ncbi:MAG TPA: hypothetical protein VJZ03_09210 [Candidatus Bathyarchaeia archaeon]|nr:hypothetical protein [Candidatus Bathyarchaeia archaeon]
MKVNPFAILLLVIGLGSLVAVVAYSNYNVASSSVPYANSNWQNQEISPPQLNSLYPLQSAPNGPITLDQAEIIAQQFLVSLHNPNLAIAEIMEFQYNFYIQFYEKDTGLGAFEMLIWKQTPTSSMMGSYGYGMMGGYFGVGVLMPEPGPNMMWNTKYGMSHMMSGWNVNWGNQASLTMPIPKDRAVQLAQAYLDTNLQGAVAESDATQFYGYYTIDFTINGQTAGMLSVNGYTGQVWLHTWHGAFIQEAQLG